MMFFILNIILGKKMKSLKFLLSTAALVALTACSSSGDGGTATLAAAAPEVTEEVAVARPDTAQSNVAVLISEEEAQGRTTFSSLFEGVNGNFLGRDVSRDDANGTLTVLIDGEEFTFDRNRFDNVLVSEDNTIAILGITETEQGRASRVSNVFLVGEGVDQLEQTDIDSISNFGFLVSQDAVGGADAIRVTPVDDLPAQATYSGRFFSISERSIAEATPEFNEQNPTGDDFVFEDRFEVTATFGQTNELTGSAFSDEGQFATIDADITGNTFSGTVTDGDGRGGTSLNGGFFGEDAREILGSGSGTVNGNSVAISIEGTRTDNVPVN
jgi:hypothetical protein